MNRGALHAALAYLLWGVFPLYFHLLRTVPAFEVLLNRVVWSLLLLVALLLIRRRWQWLRLLAAEPRIVARYVASALLIGVNWYVYIWAVQNEHVLDASLGYFITPLFNVLIARVVLGERLRPVQRLAVAIAAFGVIWLAWRAGHVPWIALVLAASFSAYGLAKKTARLGALEGLTLETALLAPVALVVLWWLSANGNNTLAGDDHTLRTLLIASGPLTAAPLLLFAAGARRIPLTTLGLLQYISPTLQLLLGVLVFGEAFDGNAALGYGAIWVALASYAAEGIVRARRTEKRPRPDPGPDAGVAAEPR